VIALQQYRAVTKLRSTYLEKMCRGVIHPSFDPIKVTGRTSSRGELNAQNLPRDDRVRSCFIPSPGNVFIAADYSTVELATLAQAVQRQFNAPSAMAKAINEGKDLHRMVAARVMRKSEETVTRNERQKAKAINFGKPGGMGDQSIQAYSQANYGLALSDVEVEEFSQTWLGTFPEMRAFLDDATNPGEQAAEAFALTPTQYAEHTGRQGMLFHRRSDGCEDLPDSTLGFMCLKVLGERSPVTGEGRTYAPKELDYFWSAVARQIARVPAAYRAAVHQRSASSELRRAVVQELDRSGVFTLTGRLRANATYTARHNTIFQGLAADGAKLAVWKLWRAGYRIVNFIHDEVLIEVPVDSNLTNHAENIRRLMIEGMQEVVPDVLIKVEYAAMDRWHKDAVATYDEHGQLQVYKESAAGTAAPSLSTPNDPGTSGQIGVPTCTAALGVDSHERV